MAKSTLMGPKKQPQLITLDKGEFYLSEIRHGIPAAFPLVSPRLNRYLYISDREVPRKSIDLFAAFPLTKRAHRDKSITEEMVLNELNNVFFEANAWAAREKADYYCLFVDFKNEQTERNLLSRIFSDSTPIQTGVVLRPTLNLYAKKK